MFETFLIKPLYNGFVYLIGVVPGGDVGLAIIVLTILIRAIFYPVFVASIRTQMGMQAAQGELNEINEKFKDDSAERMRRTQEIFKKYNVRPFMGFLALFIQLAVFIGLSVALFREGFPTLAENLLYSFTPHPSHIQTMFLGFLDLMGKYNIPIALIAGLTQYWAIYLTVARTNTGPQLPKEKAQAQIMQQRMMLYFMPVLMVSVSYPFPALFGFYLTISNLISVVQEWLIRRHIL